MASILDNYAPAPALPAAGSLMGMGDYVSSALYQHSPLMGSHLPGMGPGSSYWSHRAGQLYGGQGQAQARQYLPAPGSLLPMYSNTPSVRMSSYTTVSQPPVSELRVPMVLRCWWCAHAGLLRERNMSSSCTPANSKAKPCVPSTALECYSQPVLTIHNACCLRACMQIGEGLFMREESTLMYPPVGSTFDGRRSQSAAAASRPIDSLADFHYRRPKPLNFEGLDAGEGWEVGKGLCKGLRGCCPCAGFRPAADQSTFRQLARLAAQTRNIPVTFVHAGIGEQAVRRAQAARDQLDVFLQDYSKGANKPNPGQFYPGGRVSVY